MLTFLSYLKGPLFGFDIVAVEGSSWFQASQPVGYLYGNGETSMKPDLVHHPFETFIILISGCFRFQAMLNPLRNHESLYLSSEGRPFGRDIRFLQILDGS